MSWKRKLATVKGEKADVSVSWALALRQSIWRNCGLCVGLYAENRASLLVGIWWRENKNKLVEWRAFVDTVGIQSADLEDKFLF